MRPTRTASALLAALFLPVLLAVAPAHAVGPGRAVQAPAPAALERAASPAGPSAGLSSALARLDVPDLLRRRGRLHPASTRGFGKDDGAPDTKACATSNYTSDRDGTALDVARYGAYFGCITPGDWLFPVTTYDTFTASQVDTIGFFADGDANPATGCDGFERAAIGGWVPQDNALEAAVFRTPSCDDTTWSVVGDSDLQMPDNQTLGLQFHNRDLGGPSTLRWAGYIAATSDSASERLPATGSHTESGYQSAADACSTGSTASTRWYATASDPAAVAALRASGARAVRRTGGGLLSFVGNGVTAQLALNRVDPRAVVRSDTRLHLLDTTPNDPLLSQQWSLPQVGAGSAWDVSRGSATATVAVVDTGVDATHPDLAGKLLPGYDAVKRAALGSGNSDTVGHGTAVAGVIAAATDNATGVASLGWQTTVLPVKVADQTGQLVTTAVIDGIRYAADHGARVLNLSLGGCDQDPDLSNAISYAQSKNVFVVAAAGNEKEQGNPVEYPAADRGVLAVGATNRGGTIAHYSNTGPYVDLVAPGGTGDGVPADELTLLQTGGGYTTEAGTSFSAPMAAAAAALAISVNPSVTQGGLTTLLESTARDLGAPGRDPVYGSGLLDAAAVVRHAHDPASITPAQEPPRTPVLTGPSTAAPAGSRVMLTASAEPGSTLELLAYSRPSTTYAVARRTVVPADGTVTFGVVPGTNTRAYLRSSDAGGTTTGPSVVIPVASRLSLTATRIGTRTFRFAGRSLPRRGGIRVTVFRSQGSGFVQATSPVTTAADGSWSVTRQFTGTGTFVFVARAAATTTNVAGSSSGARVSIR